MSTKTSDLMDSLDRIVFGEIDEFLGPETQNEISFAWSIHANY
jgi:hypothetical protein